MEEIFFVYILCVASELMIDTICHNPMEKKRQEHIKELIVTEQAYIEDMRLVHEVFFIFFFEFAFYSYFMIHVYI